MLHDCRQLVSWDVWLIPKTSATLVFIKILHKEVLFINTSIALKILVNDKLKEGEN